MPKITTHLWYDNEAVEAAEFYVSVFGKDSKINNITKLENTPSGSVDIVTFILLGREFQAISAGPFFKFNPAISFLIICKSKSEVDFIWEKFYINGKVLMELGEYPFSERFGWIEDKYGLSWQIVHFKDEDITQKINPFIMFTGGMCGKAEAAINFWTSMFSGSDIFNIIRYNNNEEPDKEGTIKFAEFALLGNEFGAMDSAYEHSFSFNEAISFIVNCDTQEEIDFYWDKLSADPKAEQCGWLKDKYGISWQIVPNAMSKMMKENDKDKLARVTEAFLKMKKFDIAKLEEAYKGE